MKNIRVFYLKIFSFLKVKFSIYLNRRVFVMLCTHWIVLSSPKLSSFCLLTWCFDLILRGSKHPYLEHISMVMRIFELLKFDWKVINYAMSVFKIKEAFSCLTMYKVYGTTFLITKTYLFNSDPLKPHFYIVKLGFTGVYVIFLIFTQKHRLWVGGSSRRF